MSAEKESPGFSRGENVKVEVLEGNRLVLQVPVAALVSQFIGVGAYMDLSALNRLLREGDAISGTYLAVDPRDQPEVYAALQKMPRVAGTTIHENAIRSFYETMSATLLIFTAIHTLLAGTIAFGVVYNSARIALADAPISSPTCSRISTACPWSWSPVLTPSPRSWF